MSGAFVRVLVAGKWRECPAEVWAVLEGPLPPEGWSGCNGCSGVPDHTIGGYKVWPACVVHDFDYSHDSPEIPRWKADAKFFRNIWRCLRVQKCPRHRAAYTAWIYWRGVRHLGHTFYRRAA